MRPTKNLGEKGQPITLCFKSPRRLPSVPTMTQERKTDEHKPLLRLASCKQPQTRTAFQNRIEIIPQPSAFVNTFF